MMKYITIILFVSFFSLHAEVKQPKNTSMWDRVASLFLTEDVEDADTISSPLEANKTTAMVNDDNNHAENNTPPSIQGAYYLSSIIYSNKKNWSIWMNDQIIGPSQAHQLSHVSIKRVSADKIECQIANQNETLVLCANQTLDLSNGNILNGDQRKSILVVPEDDDDFVLGDSP